MCFQIEIIFKKPVLPDGFCTTSPINKFKFSNSEISFQVELFSSIASTQ